MQQFYESEVNNEYVIRGNAAVLKCSIPSFVADFVQVISWQDENGELYAHIDEEKATGRQMPKFSLLLVLENKNFPSFLNSRFFNFK